MGVAISIVIEVQNESGEWAAITDDLWVARDWDLFNAIAFGDNAEGSNIPFPPRGLPSDHSVGTRLRYYSSDRKSLLVFNQRTRTMGETFSPSRIKKLLSNKIDKEVYRKYGLLPASDMLIATSWLNLAELEIALSHRKLGKTDLRSDFLKVMSKMSGAARKAGKEKVRMVFWFSH